MPPKKMGRPPSDNPKNEKVHLRVDEEMKTMLDACTEALQINRSEVIRQGIIKVYNDLQK